MNQQHIDQFVPGIIHTGEHGPDQICVVEDEYEPEGFDFASMKKSGMLCPDCSEENIVSELLIYAQGTSPDDFVHTLICPKCKYTEKE